MKITQLLQYRSETQEHYLDRCYHLQPKNWMDTEPPKVLIFQKTWQEKPFHEQEWTEKISQQQFQQHLNTLPTERKIQELNQDPSFTKEIAKLEPLGMRNGDKNKHE